ncbi:hypothetical protein G5B40_10805 [Pikeienuella piscinae]|uniref:Pilus assembly protein n=1 Tax=Pikeienuella piscinae TaxID=2748098 RepID=A0A7L5C172_9RHOB|nr:hypothetical protein [Pikeienuella piscinae]QIE55894.1 hypothetical protein G5B40_10805 [Pikeienuella piscinae]
MVMVFNGKTRGMLARFFADRGGAATADWVVLTSVVVVIGVATIYFVLGPEGGFTNLINSMSSEVDQAGANMEGVAASGASAIPGSGD